MLETPVALAPLADRPLELRRATVDDLPALVALYGADAAWRAVPEDPGPPLPEGYLAAFHAIDRDPGVVLAVATLAGELAGTFQLTLLRYLTYHGSRVAQIEAVHVVPSWRSRGVGERLMRWAIDEARRQGCHRVQLTSNKRRTRAHAFYERLGFERSHEGFKLYL